MIGAGRVQLRAVMQHDATSPHMRQDLRGVGGYTQTMRDGMAHERACCHLETVPTLMSTQQRVATSCAS